MTSWAAGVMFDEGRLGMIVAFGFRSKQHAVAWLEKQYAWTHWGTLPSFWVRAQHSLPLRQRKRIWHDRSVLPYYNNRSEFQRWR